MPEDINSSSSQDSSTRARLDLDAQGAGEAGPTPPVSDHTVTLRPPANASTPRGRRNNEPEAEGHNFRSEKREDAAAALEHSLNAQEKKAGDEEEKPKHVLRVASLVYRGGALAETIFNPDEGPPLRFTVQLGRPRSSGFQHKQDQLIKPPLSNGMVEKGTILLPSGAAPYGSQQQLLGEIKAFIHCYVDIHDFWEDLIAHYVLMTWVYDRFTAIPYLRFLSDFGTGKSRLLQTVVHICYKGICGGGCNRRCKNEPRYAA